MLQCKHNKNNNNNERQKMKRYRLLKDLPYVKAGEEMEMWSDGTIAFTNHPDLPRFNKKDVQMFPLWFEEIKDSEKHFYIDSRGKIEYTHSDWDMGMLQLRKLIGNHFETKEEAEKYLAYLKAKTIIKKDAKGFKPNWQDTDEDKWCGVWDIMHKEVSTHITWYGQEDTIYFKSKEDVEESFENHPDEWKAYLTYEQ